MFEVILLLLIPFVDLNIAGCISVRYFQDRENITKFIGNVLFIPFTSFIIVFFICCIFRHSVSEFLSIPPNWLLLIPVIALGQSISKVILVLWQVRTCAYSYGVYRITQLAVNVSLSLFLVIYLGMNWKGRLYGIGITEIAFAIAALFIIKKKTLYHLSTINNMLKKLYHLEYRSFPMPSVPGQWL